MHMNILSIIVFFSLNFSFFDMFLFLKIFVKYVLVNIKSYVIYHMECSQDDHQR
jgi:hypothetical protein